MLLPHLPRILLLFGIILMITTAPAADLLPTPAPAPLCPTQPGHRIARVKIPPDLTAANPAADPAWAAADLITPLFADGIPEPADRTTAIALLLVSDTLYLKAVCNAAKAPQAPPGDDPGDLWHGDAIELFLRHHADQSFPYTQVVFAADGRLNATRYLRSVGRGSDPSAQQPAGTADLEVKTGKNPDDKGWWLTAALPLKPLGIDPTALCGNILRDTPNGSTVYTWSDLDHGSAQAPEHFAPFPIADAPLPPRPAIQLPAGLAIGWNELKILPALPGCKIQAEGAVADPREGGVTGVAALRPGHVRLTLTDPAGAVLQELTTQLRRPFLIHATLPFDADLTKPLAVELHLNVATDGNAPAEIRLVALQAGKEIGASQFTLASGSKNVELPIQNAQPGEIHLRAIAAFKVTREITREISADHWCVRGLSIDDFNKFRPGIDTLDAPALYRAALVDAWNFYRLLQAGDGRYRGLNRQGKFGFTEWSYGACYNAALLYTADWPENPYKGDKRFLASAAAGLDAGLDPEARYPSGGHSRHIRPFLLTYDLIKDQVPAARRDYWKERLLELTTEIVHDRLEPAAQRYTMYSEDVGTGTNHFAYYAAGVLAAGRIFDRPEWTQLATAALLRIAEHGRDGQFPERPGISATHYTWLTMNALGEYFQDTQDATVLPVLQRCVAYAVATALPDCTMFLLHDGRNNDYGSSNGTGDFLLALTPDGRDLARRRALQHIGSSEKNAHKPGESSPEFWWRTAENALYTPPEPKLTPTERTAAAIEQAAKSQAPAEFSFLSGRALTARRGGFLYGLSAVALQPTNRTFWVDPQNALELHHITAGPILCGANSQAQPEAGSFCRTVNGQTTFLPVGGTLVRTPNGHSAVLDYGTFTAKITIEKQSDAADANRSLALVQIDLLTVQGPEPVTFNFFPGVKQAADCTLANNGKTIMFEDIKVNCSSPVQIEKDFLILSPYAMKRTVKTKPVRAHLDLNPLKSFTLNIEITNYPPLEAPHRTIWRE